MPYAHRKEMGAFRSVFVVSLLAVGCGGRTGGTNPSAASGSTTGSVSGEGAGVNSGTATGSTGLANGSGAGVTGTGQQCAVSVPTSGLGGPCAQDAGDAQVATECPPTAPPAVWNETPGGACLGDLQCFYDTDGGLLPEYTPCAYRVGECMPNGQWSSYHTDPGSTSFGVPCGGIDASLISAPPPSCAPGGPGMTDCGPGGSGTESCCTSLEVTGGTYYRTYDQAIDDAGYNTLVLGADGSPAEEADPATVSSFRLDKYLVTVGRFRQFVSAWNDGKGYTPPAGAGKHAHLNDGNGLAATGGGYEPGWIASDDPRVAPTASSLTSSVTATWTPSAGSLENLPINLVNWWEAYAFCIWDGGFLPSEAEWEYAAYGGSQQRLYPWGSEDPGRASQYAIYFGYFSVARTGIPGLGNIAAVGFASLGAGLWGQLDLVGNLAEWNLDWWAMYGEPCVDCASVTLPMPSQNGRVTSGGYDLAHSSMLLSSSRVGIPPSSRLDYVGFRCARTP